MPPLSATFRIVRGPGTALVGPSAVALVDAPLTDAAVQSLLAPILQGKAFGPLVEALQTIGGQLPARVGLVVVDGSRSQLLLRGAIGCQVARTADRTDLSGNDLGDEPWAMYALSEPVSITLTLSPDADSHAGFIEFSSGVTSAHAVEVTPAGTPDPVATEAVPEPPAGGPGPTGSVVPDPIASAPPGDRASDAREFASSTATDRHEAAGPDVEVLPEWPPPAPTPGSDLARELAELLGDTAQTPTPSTADRRPAAPTASCPIRLPGGEVVLVGPRTVLGRNPAPNTQLDGYAATCVQLDDPDRALSRQHLAIRVHGEEITVEDLGSTNRSAVERPGHLPTVLSPGLPVTVAPNTRVVLGGSVSVIIDPR